ncbi:MAG: 50S ribosomal protein L20 [Candidatus Omnitrophota bacterium]
MARIKHSVSTRRRKRRVMKAVKGQWGARSRRYRIARESLAKGMMYATRDRKAKKREIRALWIVRINAACRELGLSYSVFMSGLKKAQVALDRKVLSDMAIHDPTAFKKLADIARG